MKFWRLFSLIFAIIAGVFLREFCGDVWYHNGQAAFGDFMLFLTCIGIGVAMVTAEDWWI